MEDGESKAKTKKKKKNLGRWRMDLGFDRGEVEF